jgi:Tfp pilus assembly protein PilV
MQTIMQKLLVIFSKNKGKREVSEMKSGSKALTLVESLVAISILVIAVFGPMSIVAQAIRTSYLTRDQMTAFYLGQEAIEYIRNIRDQNSLMYTVSSQWLDNLSTAGDIVINDLSDPNPAKYVLVLGSFSSGYDLVLCDTTCPKLNLNRVTREYGTPSIAAEIVPSIYTREVTFWEVIGDDTVGKEVAIQVRVGWTQAAGNYEYVVRDYLKNWKITD